MTNQNTGSLAEGSARTYNHEDATGGTMTKKEFRKEYVGHNGKFTNKDLRYILSYISFMADGPGRTFNESKERSQEELEAILLDIRDAALGAAKELGGTVPL